MLSRYVKYISVQETRERERERGVLPSSHLFSLNFKLLA